MLRFTISLSERRLMGTHQGVVRHIDHDLGKSAAINTPWKPFFQPAQKLGVILSCIIDSSPEFRHADRLNRPCLILPSCCSHRASKRRPHVWAPSWRVIAKC